MRLLLSEFAEDKKTAVTCFTTKCITLKNTKSLIFNLKYLNYYLIIFSKNLDLDFYIYSAAFIKVAL
jgi:hypothetical protein